MMQANLFIKIKKPELFEIPVVRQLGHPCKND
jgi:hypothetical protein